MSAPTPTNTPHENMARISTPTPTPPPDAPRIELAPPGTSTPPRRRTSNTALIITIVAVVILAPVLLCVGAALVSGIGGFLTSRMTEQTTTSTLQVAVPDHPTITVSDTAGQVTITRGATHQVSVVATKRAHAGTSASARDLLKTMTVTAVPISGGAQITATTGRNAALSRQTVDLRITVPETSNLRVTVNAGTLTITSVMGSLSLTMNAGTIDLRDVMLQGASTISVSAGTLNFNGSLADESSVTATVATGTANISLPSTSATHLTATAHVGSVSVTPWPATIQHTGAGQSTEVDLSSQSTNTLTVRVDTGSIKISAH